MMLLTALAQHEPRPRQQQRHTFYYLLFYNLNMMHNAWHYLLARWPSSARQEVATSEHYIHACKRAQHDTSSNLDTLTPPLCSHPLLLTCRFVPFDPTTQCQSTHASAHSTTGTNSNQLSLDLAWHACMALLTCCPGPSSARRAVTPRSRPFFSRLLSVASHCKQHQYSMACDHTQLSLFVVCGASVPACLLPKDAGVRDSVTPYHHTVGV